MRPGGLEKFFENKISRKLKDSPRTAHCTDLLLLTPDPGPRAARTLDTHRLTARSRASRKEANGASVRLARVGAVEKAQRLQGHLSLHPPPQDVPILQGSPPTAPRSPILSAGVLCVEIMDRELQRS